MSINQRQYDQLTEMGISLWQHKSSAFVHESSSELKDKYIKQDDEYLAALSKQTLFTDILLCLGLSIGEVSAKKDHLDLRLFNWYFNSKEQDDLTISCTDNNLVSPSIRVISQSPSLKKQLWQTIMNNLL